MLRLLRNSMPVQSSVKLENMLAFLEMSRTPEGSSRRAPENRRASAWRASPNRRRAPPTGDGGALQQVRPGLSYLACIGQWHVFVGPVSTTNRTGRNRVCSGEAIRGKLFAGGAADRVVQWSAEKDSSSTTTRRHSCGY